MEDLAAKIVVVMLGLVFAGSPVLFLWWFPRHYSRKWAATAERLGLKLDPYRPAHRVSPMLGSSPSYLQPIRGRRGSFEVECGIRASVSADHRSYTTYVRVELPRALGLGLHLEPVGLLGQAWNATVGQQDIQLGEPDLDRAYDIVADDDERCQRVLSEAPVVEALRTHGRRGFALHASDATVWLDRRGRALSAATLAEALDAACDIAQRLLEASERATPQSVGSSAPQ